MEIPKWNPPTITVTRPRLQVIDKSHLSFRLSVYISTIDDLFVCVEALRPSQQFFSHVGTDD